MHLEALRSETSVPISTAWPWESLIYAARTDSGVVVIDLGWGDAGGALARGLGRIGAKPEDVTRVFLTHSHRDHIAGWRAVPQARFHLHEAEVPYFLGRARHADLPSRTASALFARAEPAANALALRPFSGDTAFVLGADTIRAFRVSGHTPGSSAYLFRRVLFVGDAVARSYLTGYGPAYRIFTADEAENEASLEALFARALPLGVDWVCTAHGKCARPDERFLAKVLR